MNNSTEFFNTSKIINSISELHPNQINKSFQYNSNSDSSINNDELLQMELKQLRRENAFLKKKIEELKTNKIIQTPKLTKKNSINYIKILKHRSSLSGLEDKKQSTYTYVIKEVQNILKSLALLHKIQIYDSLWYENDIKGNEIFSSEKAYISIQNEFNLKLAKNLERISLESEQKRYEHLLGVFGQFYTHTKQTQNFIKSKLNSYIEQTLSISKELFEKVSAKAYQKSLLKSSEIYSVQYSIDKSSRTEMADSNCDLKDSLTADTWKRHYRQSSQVGFSAQQPQVVYNQ